MSKHKYTVELLFHFNCGVCENWWSYASTPYDLSKSVDYNTPPDHIEYYCPHCGAAENIEVKDGAHDEEPLDGPYMDDPIDWVRYGHEERLKLMLENFDKKKT